VCALLTLTALDGAADQHYPSRDGFITHFLASGPERAVRESDHDWRAAYVDAPTGLEPPRHWEPLNGSDSIVQLFDRERRHVGYLYADLVVDRPFRGYLAVGCDDDLVAWLDGEAIDLPEFVGWQVLDQYWIPLDLEPGVHSLLLGTYNARGRWSLSARLMDEHGAPATDVVINRPDIAPSLRRVVDAIRVEAAIRVDGQRRHMIFTLDYRAGRPTTTTVVCARSDGAPEADARCFTLDTLAAAPRTIAAPLGDDEQGVTLTVLAGDDEAERTVIFDVPRVTEAADAVARGRELLGAGLPDALPEGSAQSFEYEVQRIERLVERRSGYTSWLRSEARALDRLARDIESGEDPYARRRGVYYRAYRSPIDGQLQPYAVFVPDRYRPSRAMPLVVSLHGLSSRVMMNLRQVLGYDRAEEESANHAIRNFPDIEDAAAIFVSPYGHRNAMFRFMGESDVLRVIDEMQAAYNIDSRRIYLTGLSMGGIGTFDIGLHHADQFAALLSLAGTADLRRYSEMREYPVYDWELALCDEYSASRYAENAVNLPVHAIHGTRDGTSYRHSQDFLEALDELGFETSLETPRLGHNVWRDEYADDGVLRRVSEYRRERFPDEVRLVTASYRYNEQAWVRVDRLAAVHTFSRVQATVRRRRGQREISVSTSGVEALTLSLGDAPERWTEDPASLSIDGVPLCSGECWRTVHATRVSGSWQLAPQPDRPEGKRPGLEGPVQDAYYAPMLVVRGTADPELEPLLRRLTASASTFHERLVDVELPVVADVDLTEEQLASHHLLLWGRPAQASPLGGLLDELPIQVVDEGALLGDQLVAGDDVAAVFAYPNPRSTDRYVVAHLGNSPAAIDSARFAPRFSPDFLVFGPAIREGFLWQRTLRSRPVAAGGFFDDDWALPTGNAWLNPTPVSR